MDGSRTEEVMMQQDPEDRCSEEDVLKDHYEILKTLGTGNFAQVKLAFHLLTHTPVALKRLEKDNTNSSVIENELEIMKFLDHPNIIKLFHVLETTKHIYMVLEYASGGDLACRILEGGRIPEVEVQHIFTQLTCAVKYCHENDIAHRDIKPENILIDERKNVKLCDFGIAINVSAEPESTVFCGTLPYCAPELFSSQGYDPRPLDIWSMGVVLYIMMTKRYPFKAMSYDQMKIEMQKPQCFIPPKIPVHIASLIIKLFTVDPGQRPKIQDIVQYQWLKGSEEFPKPTLSLEPLPNKPNPSVIAAMWGMGYSAKDIADCLYENNFNSLTATYLTLKYHSPCVDNSNHNENLTQPNIAMAPADPPTCHSFLKSIGSEPDNSTSTLSENYPSQGDEMKETKNHSMPSIRCCQQKSQPHSTGVQCGPFQHGHEHLLSSRASKSLSCGPVLHVHEYHLCSSLQQTDIVSKNMSCGPVQHNQDEHLLSITLQNRSRGFKSLSCGPAQTNHEQFLSSSMKKIKKVSKSMSCGPVQHNQDEILTSSLQKTKRVSKSMSYGPIQPNREQFLSSSLQKIKKVSESMSCGPVQHNQEEHLLSITLENRRRVFKSLSCGPALPNHEEQLLRSSLQERGRASKSVFGGPVQHDLKQHLDILSEDHTTQVEAQNENPHKSSSFLQHTPSSRSSKQRFEDVTTTGAHQDKSLTPQEIWEPKRTSAQRQRVTTASSRLWGIRKQVKRRLVKGLRRLCCCLPAEERSRTFQRRVAPQEGGHNGVT